MQRKENDNIILSCDFCGRDWDEIIPMIEGHKGSIICIDCIKSALDNIKELDSFTCTMCLQEYSANTKCWKHPSPLPSPGLNIDAIICLSDINQAAKAFDKDGDTDFTLNSSKYPL